MTRAACNGDPGPVGRLSANQDLAPDRPLSILGVDPELRFAGGESQVLALASELCRAGHHADLLCNPRGALWRRAGEIGVRCHALAIRNAIDLRAGLRMRHFLSRARYDVVHFHTSRAHAMAPFARGLAEALVVTRRMDTAPNRLFAPYLYNRAVDGVAAISAAAADSLVAAGVERQRLAIIPSGIDSERFRPPSEQERGAARASLGIRDGEIAVGTLGALEWRKNHRCLIEAIARCEGGSADHPAVRCFIAGDGSLKAALGAQARDLGCGERVRLLGAIDEPRKLLWALDIFAFPSIREGLGVALLEAMACGLPTVASRAGGIIDAVEDQRTGLLVRQGDAAGLGAAICWLAARPPKRETLGVAARRRAAERFSISAMARETLALYQRCLGHRVRST